MFKDRYRRILWFFARVLLSIGWWDIVLPRLGLGRLAARTRRQRLHDIAVAFRTLAIQMGGVMIKVGQFLSSRLDVMPPEITDELADLQDEVRPEDFEAVRRVVESELDAPLEQKFTAFEIQPLASASIGQVHCARLPDNAAMSRVVVKAQRPQIEAIVAVDLAALRVVGGWVHRYPPVRRRVNIPALIEEFSRSLHEEIDYLQEGKNAETFAANFAGRPEIAVPQVVWSHTTRRVLTLQDVQAIKITDYAAIDAAGIDRKQVAVRLLDTYLKQIFEDRFFHADPHPGNLFVLPTPEEGPGTWRLIFVDFGMVGRISSNQLTGLREILIAVGTRDAARLIKGYQMLEILLNNADLDLLVKASSHVFDRFWGKSTPEIMGLRQEETLAFIQEFGEILYDMPFQIPENLILLGRCMAILNGICTGLDADFNVWTNVAPYARKLVEADTGGGMQFWLGEIGDIVRAVFALPKKTEALLARIEQGKLEIRTPDLKNELHHLERSQKRIANAILFAAFLLAAVQLHIAGFSLLALAGAVCAALLFLWLLFSRR